MKKLAFFLIGFAAAGAAIGGTYYVDAEKGDDAWDGSSATRVGEAKVGPMKTLAGVLGVATNSGDVVWAAEGVYSNGTMEVTNNATYLGNGHCRAILRSGVTLRASGSKEKTFIVGAKATTSKWNGCGEDSVRCVYLYSKAKLIGFTVTGGYARYTDSYKAGGGGIHCARTWSAEKLAVVSDCIISNNWAQSYGGCYYGCLVRCRITGNHSVAMPCGVGGMDECAIFDCFIDGNSGSNNNCYQADSPQFAVNTTFGDSDRMIGVNGNSAHKSTFYNCVFLRLNSGLGASVVRNCAFNAADAYAAAWVAADTTVASFATNVTALAVEANGRLARASCLLDAGLASLHTSKFPSIAENGYDVDGGTRVLGPEIDIGAAEYDVKGDPVDPLGYMTVTAANTGVVPSGERDLKLLNGGDATVVSRPASVAGAYTIFSAEVLGTGTLAIYKDGASDPWQTVTAADGRMSFSWTSATDAAFRFVLSGGDADSRAILSDFSNVTYARIVADHGQLIVTGANIGMNYVAPAGTLSFTIRRQLTHDLFVTGLNVNGVFHSFEDEAPDGMTFSFTVTDDDRSTSLEIEAVYETPSVCAWYVDDDGSDGNSGLSKYDAFKTLCHALTNSYLASGETVWVLPGTYDEGTMPATSDEIKSSASLGLNRAAVKGGVTLRSTEGPEKTIIKGAKATKTVWGDGCGEDSVRCVYLAPAAKLTGFTLTGGRAYCNSAKSTGCYAGGVFTTYNYSLTDSGYAIVSDCIISNNSAYAYGGAYQGRYVRCRIIGNTAASAASGIGGRNIFWLYDSFVNGNTGTTQVNQPASGCVNVTFGPDGATMLANNEYQGQIKYYNCLFLGTSSPIIYKSGNEFVGYNCVFADTVSGAAAFIGTEHDHGCRVLSAEELALDADSRPLKESELVDTGSNEYHTAYFPSRATAGGDASVDVPRTLNARIDIGAFEYDWRADYSKDLSKRSVKVTNASPTVVETAEKSVRLVDCASIEMTCRYRGGVASKVMFRFGIVGGGTLTASIGGVPVATFGADDTVWTHKPTAAEEDISFSFEGDGTVDLLKLVDPSGFMVIFR